MDARTRRAGRASSPRKSGIAGAAGAAAYDRFSRWLGSRLFGRRLSAVLRDLTDRTGCTLEIGAGTGGTLEHYGQASGLAVLTEPDTAMLHRALIRAAELGRHVAACRCRAEALPFRAGVFDAVIASLVLCTVADQPRALAEARRVLRPGGTLRFLEHVRGEGWIGQAQDALTPAWQQLAGGCCLNRRTEAAIGAAGFALERIDRRPLFGLPAIAGVATSPAA